MFPVALVALMGVVFTTAVRAAPIDDLVGIWIRPPQRGPSADARLRLPAVEAPPLNAKYRGIYEAAQKARLEADERGEPLINDRTLCLPDGMPKMLTTTFPIEITRGRDKLTLIAEFNTQVRHIVLGDAQHPPADQLDPTFFGHSIGRWQDGVLVVDTVGLRSSTVLFEEVPHSEQLRIVERIRVRQPDLLEIEVTMIDPEVLMRPWTVTRWFVRSDEPSLREFVCAENNRHSATPTGTIGLDVPE